MWVPVLFACLVGSECKFYADPVMTDAKACQAHIDAYLAAAEKATHIKAATGACIPVKFTGGNPVRFGLYTPAHPY
jgi:hypothetical protein